MLCCIRRESTLASPMVYLHILMTKMILWASRLLERVIYHVRVLTLVICTPM